MKRSVIYARYSSDLQSEASIDDQVRLCREAAEREGMSVQQIFADYAISGGSLNNRPGMLSLLDAAQQGGIDVVIAEALDRVSRDQEDIAAIFKTPAACGGLPADLGRGRDQRAPRRSQGDHERAVPQGPGGQDPAWTARPGRSRENPGWQQLWLRNCTSPARRRIRLHG